MIDLQARQKYVYYSIIKRAILLVVALPAALFGLVMMFVSMVRGNEVVRIPLNISFIFAIIACWVGVFFIIFDAVYQKKLRKMAITQFYVIVNTTKIIDNPKVLYIYTCHNDLIESRILQNIQQTYKNIDVWISDGSTDELISNKYKEFAIRNNLNYYKVIGGSKSKAHNLNTFLENINPSYDYLLVTDTDEVLHSRFVEEALKCFYSKCFNNLGFVSPLNYCYETETLFSNLGSNLENGMFYKQNFSRSITLGDCPNLYSSSCLISKELMQMNKNRFPNSNLEDFYLEYVSISKGFVSLILPTAPCGQSFDKTIWHYFRRVMRVYDWSIKLVMDGAFDVYNEKYNWWYGRLFGYSILLAPGTIIGILISPLPLWFITVNYYPLFTNIFFDILLGSGIILGIVTIITALMETGRKDLGNKYAPFAGVFSFFYGMAFVPKLIQHWFIAVFKDKYSGFASSRGTKINKPNLKPYWIVAITSLLLLTIYIVCHALFIKFALNWNLLAFFYVTIILLIVFFCSISYVVLDAFGKAIVNKQYDESKFVYPKKFYEFNNEQLKAQNITQGTEVQND